MTGTLTVEETLLSSSRTRASRLSTGTLTVRDRAVEETPLSSSRTRASRAASSTHRRYLKNTSTGKVFLVDSISKEATAALSTSAVDHGSEGTAQANSASMASVSVTALLKKRMSPDEQSDPPSSFSTDRSPPAHEEEKGAEGSSSLPLLLVGSVDADDGSSGSTRRANVRTERIRRKTSL